MSKCLKCGVNMLSEGVIEDNIQLCHPCYEKEYTVCGDHLVKECGCKL